jgi:hypothetical protein
LHSFQLGDPRLALQLHFYFDSESMCHRDSEVMDGGGIDRDGA